MDSPSFREELIGDISRSHKEPGSSALQSSVLMRCVKFLSSDFMANELDLFAKQEYQPIAGHALIMFSFPGKTNTTVEERLARSVSSSIDNARCFYKCLSELKHRFVVLRHIPVAQVNQFIEIVNRWVASRLQIKIKEGLDGVSAYECLQNPTLLRNNKVTLDAVVKYYVATVTSDPTEIVPAAIMLAMDDDKEKFSVGFRLIHNASSKSLDPQTIDEFHFQLYRVQDAKYFTPALAKRFWSLCAYLFRALDTDQLGSLICPRDLEEQSQYTQIRLFPLIRVLLNNILAQMDVTFIDLLKVLDILLLSLKQDFWAISEGTHYRNFTDAILQSQLYARLLQQAITEGEPSKLSELTSWFHALHQSLNSSQKQTAALTLSDFCLSHKIPNTSATNLLSSTFNVDLLAKCRDDPSFYLRLSDARKVVSKYAGTFISAAKNASGPNSMEINLIRASLTYDVMFTAYNSSQLSKKQIPTLLDINSSLWEAVLQIPFRSTFLVNALIQSLSDVNSIIVFKPKKNESPNKDKDLEAAISMHNKDARKLCTNVSALLEKLALTDPDTMRESLTNASTAMAIWSCIFSPETNQSSLNILYQVFDAEGRFEAICGLLRQSFKDNLAAIVASFETITKLKVFEPCPKAVRILMDVTNALTDPLTGILTTSPEFATDSAQIVQQLWTSSWSLLVMIYQLTLIWASMYHLSDLIEFTRDVLDVSHSLLDSFRPLLDFFDDPIVRETLFGKFLKAFNYVIVWLRLGDMSLLNSCVNLVFKGFDLAKEMGVDVDKEFLATFVKYGARAKKFNNKLTEKQREDVLAKASEFDKELVRSVVEEARRQRAASKEIPSQPSHVDKVADKGATYAYQSGKPKQSKQSLLTRFGVVSKDPPVAPAPPKPFKSNNLEAIRNELKNNRTPQKPAAAPAPPRPAGFNSKRAPVVGRSLNTLRQTGRDSDSSEDEDEDIDTSDLFLDSKKKAKITELDINGNPVAKVAQRKKAEQDRRDEERMRMRLNVNLKPLYSTVLRWNYNSDSAYPTEDRDIYQPIKDTYSDVKEYVRLTEPLLMLECWQGIQSSRTTGQEVPVQLLVGSRTTCDGFFDVYASIKKADLATRKIGETDLMVLGYVADKHIEAASEVASYLKKPGTQTCLAKVRSIKHANSDYCDITLRVYPQGSMMGLLTPKTVIVGMKVMQMITVEREYSSLKGLPYYDLCDDILSATPAEPVNISDEEARSMSRGYDVNISQAKAILASARTEGFSLIQGPPGTGKTKTILGIVGHFLTTAQSENTIRIPTPSNSSRSATPEDTAKGPKVLICAPSNAAVDELVLRVRDGVVNAKGEPINPKIVRLGRSDAINQAVRDLSLEEQIDRQLNVKANEAQIDPNIRNEHTKCIAERDRIREELKRGDLRDEQVVELETKLRDINKKRSELGKRLDDQRENASIAYRTREIERRQLQAKILSEARIICSTLSGSAHEFLASMSMTFDQVIIDEACQCVELSAIIPLRYGCKKCIMVGDPNQLPPTVLSQKAASFKYEESLFVRMQRRKPNSVYLLDVQYRMHPQISRFPSLQFYNSRLKDGNGMYEKNDRPWHREFPYSPYRFFDILSKHQQSDKTKSFFNYSEAQVALELVQKLMDLLPTNHFKGRIGIISPYKEQIRTLKDVFQRKYGRTILDEIDFNTVDGFQGQEKEIIIMSCVRASESGSVGFLSDIRRMNVALTRARTTLWILGNKKSLKRDKVWSKLIQDAEDRNCVTSAEPGFLKMISSKPTTNTFNYSSQVPPIGESTKEQIDNCRPSVKRPSENDRSSSASDSSEPPRKKASSLFNSSEESSNNLLPQVKTKMKTPKSGVYVHPGTKVSSPFPVDKPASNSPSSSEPTPSDEKSKVADNSASAKSPSPPKAVKSGVYAPPVPKARKKSTSIFIKRKGNSRQARPSGPPY
ncbi:hypothetical protein FDK38_000193 [Candidozyma auris]|nr:hypothetical protein FDK38_000193 [[Candida] auris]